MMASENPFSSRSSASAAACSKKASRMLRWNRTPNLSSNSVTTMSTSENCSATNHASCVGPESPTPSGTPWISGETSATRRAQPLVNKSALRLITRPARMMGMKKSTTAMPPASRPTMSGGSEAVTMTSPPATPTASRMRPLLLSAMEPATMSSRPRFVARVTGAMNSVPSRMALRTTETATIVKSVHRKPFTTWRCCSRIRARALALLGT